MTYNYSTTHAEIVQIVKNCLGRKGHLFIQIPQRQSRKHVKLLIVFPYFHYEIQTLTQLNYSFSAIL